MRYLDIKAGIARFFYNWKLILLLGLLVLSTWDWIELMNSGGLGFIRMNFGWLFITWVVFLGAARLITSGILRTPAYWQVCFLGFLIAITPFFINVTPAFKHGLYLVIGLFGCLVCYLSIFQFGLSRNHLNQILILIIGIAFLQSVIALLQLLHSLAMQYTSNVDEFLPTKISGTFVQRNLLASYISTGLVITYFLSLKKQSFLKEVKKSYKLVFYGLRLYLFIGSFVLVCTESRIGLLSLLCGFLLLYLNNTPLNLRRHYKVIAPVLSGILLGTIFIYLTYGENSKDFSFTQSREIMYLNSIEAIKDAPVLGHGLGSFEKAYVTKIGDQVESEEYGVSYLYGRPANISHPHNELIYWAVQGGLVSVTGLLLLSISVILPTLKAGLRRCLTYGSLFVPILLHMMVELPLYISSLHILLIIFLAFYYVDSIGFTVKRNLRMETKVSKAGMLFIVSACVTVSSILLLNIYSLKQAINYQEWSSRTEEQLSQSVIQLGWNDFYEALLYKHRGNNGAKTGDLDKVHEYKNWLKNQIEITPRLEYYLNLYRSYILLGDTDEAVTVKLDMQKKFAGVKQAIDAGVMDDE